MFRNLTCIFFLSSAACAEQVIQPAPAASGTIAALDDRVYTALPEHNAISVYDRIKDEVHQYEVGARPARVTVAGDMVLVTLQGERALVVLSAIDHAQLAKVEVGAEPVGVVASGGFAYVAVSMANEVVEVDLQQMEVVRRFEVEAQPRWLALHPGGRDLYVASMMKGQVTWIDLDAGRSRALDFDAEVVDRFDGQAVNKVILSRRMTGDPAVSIDGGTLFLPAILIDNTTEIVTPTLEEMIDSLISPRPGYQNRTQPLVYAVPLDNEGTPVLTRARSISVGPFPHVGLVSSVPASFGFNGGQPASVSVEPSGDLLVISMFGSNLISVIDISAQVTHAGQVKVGLNAGGGPAPGNFAGSSAGAGSLSIPGARPGLATMLQQGSVLGIWLATDRGPRGSAFLGDGSIFVDCHLDQTAVVIDADDLRSFFGPGASRDKFRTQLIQRSVRMALPVLTAEAERGRKLFFATADGVTAGHASGISCATCHFDGRNDGLTWSFQGRGPRQTPSLAGKISLTAPFGWEGAQPTVADEALATSHERMGGLLTEPDARAIAAFLEITPEVDPQVLEDESVARGRAIFARPEVGCADCHNGPRLTDNQPYTMFGVEGVVTRSLVGIGASAPYLHDGSVPTLRALLERLEDGSMGSTAELSASELDDLERYLRSL